MSEKIYVNATILHERPEGLGVYAKSIINNLKTKEDIKVFAPIDIDGVEVIKTTKYVKPSYKKKGGLVRLLYTQFIMPFKVPKDSIIYHPFQYLCLFSRKKQIITIHDFIPLYYKEVAKHQYKYYKYFMPMLLKKAHKIICISENTKKDLLKFYNIDENKVRVIYNGYNKEIFNMDNIKEETLSKYKIDYPYIIMVGASYAHKNLHRAIEAFSEIEEKRGTKLIIIGKDSPYIKRLKELSKSLGVEEHVIFLGYVPNEDLNALYNKSIASLYPTLYEGFGLPLLESWACNTLALCSNNSSLGELQKGGAITFNPEKVEEIREAIEKAIDPKNALEIEKIKNIGRENLKKFSWEKTAEKVYNIIKE